MATCIRCLKLQVPFCQRATNYRALLWKTMYAYKASYGSSPPCIQPHPNSIFISRMHIHIYCTTLYHAAPHCTTQHHDAPHSQKEVNIIQSHPNSNCVSRMHIHIYCTTLHHTVQHCTTLHHTHREKWISSNHSPSLTLYPACTYFRGRHIPGEWNWDSDANHECWDSDGRHIRMTNGYLGFGCRVEIPVQILGFRYKSWVLGFRCRS